MRRLFVFLLIIFMPFVSMGGTGSVDNRRRADWSLPEYSNIVFFIRKTDKGSRVVCTAQYVDKDIILTARHCITDYDEFDNNEKVGSVYTIRLNDGRETKVIAEKYGRTYDTDDWAFLRVIDSNFYSNDYFDVQDKTVARPVQNAGFGFLAILDKKKLERVKQVFEEIAEADNLTKFFEIYDKAKGILLAEDIKLDDWDESKDMYPLKVDMNCEIKDNKGDILDYIFHATCDAFQGNSGGPYFFGNKLYGIVSRTVNTFDDRTDYGFGVRNERFVSTLNDMRKVTPSTKKTVDNPVVTEAKDKKVSESPRTTSKPVEKKAPLAKPLVVKAPDVKLNDPMEVGEYVPEEIDIPVEVPVVEDVPTETPKNKEVLTQVVGPVVNVPTGVVLPEEQQEKLLVRPLSVNNPKAEEQEVSPIETFVAEETTLTDKEMKSIEKRIETESKKMDQEVLRIKRMSDKEFLHFLGRAVDLDVLRKRYEEALERERSLPNRVLGAVSIGATGIGGMMAASALSEQAADAQAEREMQAYLKTFTCEYGGNRVDGGETNVELPGGNDMISLYTEYATLANDLKMRKELLGIAPGIESEVSIDKADTGLYDDVGTGITGGVYASIARAIMNPDGEDAAKWNEQKENTGQQLKIGATVAGAGAIGGAVGNVLINYTDQDDSEENEE
ncbi:MAG: trypsin-like serine protease [Alphaproteobacteria bacterium]|nr:trypsin-like serine protease [Alphaproteobacteria bacterium]